MEIPPSHIRQRDSSGDRYTVTNVDVKVITGVLNTPSRALTVLPPEFLRQVSTDARVSFYLLYLIIYLIV